MTEPVDKLDLIGRKLAVGSSVALSFRRQELFVGCVIQLTKKMVKVKYKFGASWRVCKRYPEDLVLLEGPALVEYLLKRND